LAWRIDARLGPASLGVRLTRTFLLDSLALLATIAIAAISYRYLEKPWLLLKQQYEYINTKTVWSDAAKVDNKNSLRGFGSKSASSDRI
jgi:peptidoglycan/LPS O-acetylase OafA/YrhL